MLTAALTRGKREVIMSMQQESRICFHILLMCLRPAQACFGRVHLIFKACCQRHKLSCGRLQLACEFRMPARMAPLAAPVAWCTLA